MAERSPGGYGPSSVIHRFQALLQGARAEPLLSSGEIARRIGVAPATISAWVRQGRLVPTITTMGGRYRWHWSDVQRQMREQQQSNEN